MNWTWKSVYCRSGDFFWPYWAGFSLLALWQWRDGRWLLLVARVAVLSSTLLGIGPVCGGPAPLPLTLSPTAMTSLCSGLWRVSTCLITLRPIAAAMVMCVFPCFIENLPNKCAVWKRLFKVISLICSDHVQIVRGLLMGGISIGMLGFILSLVGMECTYIGGKEKEKNRAIFVGSLCHTTSGTKINFLNYYTFDHDKVSHKWN